MEYNSINNSRPFVETGSQDITLAVLPFFHIYAMTTIMIMSLRLGMKVITLPKFDPDLYIKALIAYKPTLLNLVPPLVSYLATNQKVKSQHLASVKFVTGGAAPFGPTLISNFMKKCSPNTPSFQEGFGMTESSPVTHVQPIKDSYLGGCGFPVPNTMAKVVDLETGEALPPDQDGELCVSGPQVSCQLLNQLSQLASFVCTGLRCVCSIIIIDTVFQVMTGYHRNKRATKNTVKDGWLHTGDVARYRDDGQFIIVDRLKELIKVKGHQVKSNDM